MTETAFEVHIDVHDFIPNYLDGLKVILDSLALNEVQELIHTLASAYEQGKRVFIVGNGGSAATASHMACDLGKTVLNGSAELPDRRFKVLALTDNVPLITAWGNDASYDCIFAEQLRNLAGEGDLLIVISASGNSPNIVEAVRAARQLGVYSFGLLGFDGGVVRALLDQSIVVHCEHYGYIEDVHMMIVHLVTAYFRGI